MANFFDLAATATLYDMVMSLWSIYRRRLNLDVLVLKYEDLVSDVEQSARMLCDHVGLAFEPGMTDFTRTARNQAWINTPSYHQVVNPISKCSVGRWTHYKEQMDGVFPVLDKWIEGFGYSR